MNLHSIRFSYVFVRFFTFLLLLDKVCAFSSAFLCVHIRTNQTVTYWTKVFRKNFFVRGTALFRNIALIVHTQNFRPKFFLYITVYLVRIWIHKNADEKAHTFSRRSKNVKKRTKTYEKRILCKFTLTLTHNLSHQYIQNTSFLQKLNSGNDVTKYDVINSKINLFTPALENQLRIKI